MSRGRQYIEFEGLFSESVLGIFRIIRGFADLRDLAAVSVPYKMEDGEQGFRVVGHQRVESAKHAEEIKNYLEKSENRFLPEVILSVRSPVKLMVNRGEIDPDELGLGETVFGVKGESGGLVDISRRYSSPTMRMQRLRVRCNNLEQLKQDKIIRRIDGNHRLHLAEQLTEDQHRPTKYLAPFCFVLLGPPGNSYDDYAESLIFHTINSTGLPLESEHSLRLLLGQDPAHAMTPDNEFAYNPALHLTRLLSDRLRGLPQPARQRFGERPLSALWESARNLIAMDGSIAQNRQTLTTFAYDLFAALADIATLLTVNHPSLCGTYGFFELAARVWREAEGENHEQRVHWSVNYLDRIGHWLGGQGITSLLDPLSPAEQLLKTFKAALSRIPKRVFLARWYPSQQHGATEADVTKATLRLQQFRQTLTNLQQQHGIGLELIDMGTEEGGTFPIHSRMYEAIASSDIIICDLTGHRPNVYVEAGYALKHHESNRLIFLFEPTDADDRVPFDLSTFKYVPITQAAEIPNRLRPELESILQSAGALLRGTRV
ncbi:hypothetical protein [Trichlorobacter ammonificans]|uniref:DUF4011 domain-containing protein n=1 Tax=Trichlorobacter ammonificans TaxID=2916410 RepID=A0ABM9D8C6_9BACT|nr:hypothetical protein [Trichlorobacter ammonificans]CAH2031407.1 conserved protein of unknown function [Trichlorobacter ammonificans]